MENQKNKLWIKLELLIHRLQDTPSIMHDLKLDYEGGMDIKEINRLSDRDIFRVEEKDGETFLIISHPVLPDELAERWCVRSQPGGWNSVNDHPHFNSEKLQRTIKHLRAWQGETTQEGIPLRVSTGKPTAGNYDGKLDNRQQILELAQEIRELAEDGRNIPNKFHGAGLRVEEIIHLGLFHEDVFFRLQEFAKSGRYNNSQTPYTRASIEVIDWIRDHPKSFSFDLPTFYMGDCYYRTDSGIRIASYMRDYWKTNIPALAEVIELQCEAEFSNHVGESTGGESQLRYDEGDTTPSQPQYVTLDQISAIANRSKSTAEKWKKRDNNPLPPADIKGGGGKPDEWEWSESLRQWLEKESGKQIPARYPNYRLTGTDRN